MFEPALDCFDGNREKSNNCGDLCFVAPNQNAEKLLVCVYFFFMVIFNYSNRLQMSQIKSS